VPQTKPLILIVEDDASVRLFLRKAVERCGFASHVAASVTDARALISTTMFACAMVDKNLPDGSGLELLALLRREQPKADVIVVTGYVNSESAIEALRLGAVDYLCKPFDFETLEHRLKAVLERRRSLEERSQLEAMLAHADRLSSLGALAAGVVHEINNPLSFVGTNLIFLSEELGELKALVSPQLAARLQICIDAATDASDGAQRVATIVKDLRTFSRKDEGPPEIVTLEDCLEGSLSVAAPSLKKTQVRIERRFGPPSRVRCAASRLEQVFLNLIVNAAYAINDSGRSDGLITLTTLATPEGEAVAEIADNGVGMSPQIQKRLFEPFFTTKPRDEGTGLGLSVCHGIVHGAGGRIEVRSEAGAGTVFRVTLPSLAAPRQVA
jgi:signal transduction histidine kinase